MNFFNKIFANRESKNNYSGKTLNQKAEKTNKILFLSKYLTTREGDFFKINFRDDIDIYDIVMWVFHNEEDENIIAYCEDILQTNQLFVETLSANNQLGFEIIISYKNKKTVIPYKNCKTDRDTTIKTLNKAIQCDFEIRLCKDSLSLDTLCFLPLKKEDWIYLETKYPKQVAEKFEIIKQETKLFI